MPPKKRFTEDELKERATESRKRWCAANPEKVREMTRVNSARRRERLKHATSPEAELAKQRDREYQAAWRRNARAEGRQSAIDAKDRKRSQPYRAKTNDARAKHPERSRVWSERYRQNPQNQFKERARSAVNTAVARGEIVPPESCCRCGKQPGKARDGRRLIRADHYMGYEQQHWLTVQWICCTCDGIITRERAALAAQANAQAGD